MRKDNSDVSDNAMRFAVTPGVTWFPSKNWALQFGLTDIVSYTSSDLSGSTFGFNPSTNGVSLGVAYNIAK
jgi:hypothetical protein